jgi:hypothetical protein
MTNSISALPVFGPAEALTNSYQVTPSLKNTVIIKPIVPQEEVGAFST